MVSLMFPNEQGQTIDTLYPTELSKKMMGKVKKHLAEQLSQ